MSEFESQCDRQKVERPRLEFRRRSLCFQYPHSQQNSTCTLKKWVWVPFILRQFCGLVLFMRHRVAFLLLNQHYALYLLIEKTAFAWYYVITARETNKKQKGGKYNAYIISVLWNLRNSNCRNDLVLFKTVIQTRDQ